MSEHSPAIPAATLILFRERDGQLPEHLMIERAGHLSFAAGALVFPGGRIEPEDHALTQREQLLRNRPADDDDAAARVAAIRETLEETGVAVAITPSPDAATILAWRAKLIEGVPFAELLAETGARLDLDQLVPFARWLPKFLQHKRFDTRFYLARVDDACVAQVDGTEATRHLWMTAEGFLAGADAGQHRVIFPTRRNLERLAAHGRFDAVVAHARTFEVRTISPWIQEIDGREWLCIPEDAGYPVTREPLDRALRG